MLETNKIYVKIISKSGNTDQKGRYTYSVRIGAELWTTKSANIYDVDAVVPASVFVYTIFYTQEEQAKIGRKVDHKLLLSLEPLE